MGRVCAIASDCLEGTLHDDASWGALVEAHSKLFLYAVPYMSPAVVGVEQRLALSKERDSDG